MKLMTHLCGLAVLFFAVNATAELEKEFGVIDGYRYGENTIVISDRSLVLSDGVKIYKENGSAASKSSLKVGAKLLYVTKWLNNKHTVLRIDLLPSTAKAEQYESQEE